MKKCTVFVYTRNQFYSSVRKHTRKLLWFLRSSWCTYTCISDMRTKTFKLDLIIIMCMNLEQKIYVRICALFTLPLYKKYAYVTQAIIRWRINKVNHNPLRSHRALNCPNQVVSHHAFCFYALRRYFYLRRERARESETARERERAKHFQGNLHRRQKVT